MWSNPHLNINRSYAEVTNQAYGCIYSKYLKIKKSYTDTILKVTNAIGLQLRFGDCYMQGNPNNHYLTPVRFTNLQHVLKNKYPENTQIYLTTDNAQAYTTLKQIYAQLSYYQWDYVNEIDRHFDHAQNNISLIRVILEHYTLSKCHTIITSKTSNFGVTAALCGKCYKCGTLSSWWQR